MATMAPSQGRRGSTTTRRHERKKAAGKMGLESGVGRAFHCGGSLLHTALESAALIYRIEALSSCREQRQAAFASSLSSPLTLAFTPTAVALLYPSHAPSSARGSGSTCIAVHSEKGKTTGDDGWAHLAFISSSLK